MAEKTACMTPDAIYHSHITPTHLEVKVDFPFELDLSEREAELLDILIHNQLEIALASFWRGNKRKK